LLPALSLSRDNAGSNVDILLNVHDVFQGPAARDNAGSNVDILLNVHDVFQRPAARDNAGNNVDILLNVHDVFQGSAARDNARYLHCFQHYLLLQVPETRHAHLI
jgi:hypothetical protein